MLAVTCVDCMYRLLGFIQSSKALNRIPSRALKPRHSHGYDCETPFGIVSSPHTVSSAALSFLSQDPISVDGLEAHQLVNVHNLQIVPTSYAAGL